MFSCSQSSTLYHCAIHPGTSGKCEGRDHVCKSVLHGTDACNSGMIVQVSALYNWRGITTGKNPVPRRSGTWELTAIGATNERFSSPVKNSHLGHHTGVGHPLPRTGSPSVNTGSQYGGCIQSKVKWAQYVNVTPKLVRFLVQHLILWPVVLVFLCLSSAEQTMWMRKLQ